MANAPLHVLITHFPSDDKARGHESRATEEQNITNPVGLQALATPTAISQIAEEQGGGGAVVASATEGDKDEYENEDKKVTLKNETETFKLCKFICTSGHNVSPLSVPVVAT